MKTRKLKDIEVSAVGMGCMAFSHGYGKLPSEQYSDEVRRHLEGSLDCLRTDYVDIYYLHRMGGVPVEKVAEAMGRLIDDGFIRGWGLSQVDVDVNDAALGVFQLSEPAQLNTDR